DPEIDHALRALEQAEALVELAQLVGRAAAVAFGLGPLDIRIVELPLEPAHRRGRAPAAGLDAAVGVLAGTAHAEPCFSRRSAACVSSPSASAAIRLRRMPSRIPRSATPSRSAGQMSRIASRIAQPATTRS